MSSSCKRQQHRPVANGGLFSSHKVTVSKETQQLLKVMMTESKLTNFQRRTLNAKVKEGEPLPLQCSPTSSKPISKIHHSSTRRPTVKKNPDSTGLRSFHTIQKIQKFEEDNCLPPPAPEQHRGYNSGVEKERLQTLMANEEITKPLVLSPPPSLYEEEDDRERTTDEILQEIEERQSFLEEMERLGEGKKYKNKIVTEISQKLRELELLQQC